MKQLPQLNKIDQIGEIVERIITDQASRIIITRESHYWFFHLYFSSYVTYPTADFQKEMIAITEDETIRKSVIVAFRGSGKSTIMTMSYPIWAILGKLKKKHVVILSQTQQQAKSHLLSIKRELESNELLRKDLGPFHEEQDEWGSSALIISNFNARIIAASTEQSIRGIRFGPYRPDLIICDDVEDLNSVKTRESRDKTFSWLTGEIFPAGDRNTKYILIGNLLHEDSLLMRVKQMAENKKIDALFKAYPLLDKQDNTLWPGKFPYREDIIEYKLSIGDERAWQREYMLKIIPDQAQIIKDEWIKYYDVLPESNGDFHYVATGIDLAISEKETADYTAMVSARVYGNQDTLRIYILPDPVNIRMGFPETVEKIKGLVNCLGKYKSEHKLFVEDVAYQRAVIQELTKQNYCVEGAPTHGKDKWARLNFASLLISSGKVLFPRNLAKLLIDQLLYFGVEKHDDLSDALTILLTMILEHDRPPIDITWI